MGNEKTERWGAKGKLVITEQCEVIYSIPSPQCVLDQFFDPALGSVSDKDYPKNYAQLRHVTKSGTLLPGFVDKNRNYSFARKSFYYNDWVHSQSFYEEIVDDNDKDIESLFNAKVMFDNNLMVKLKTSSVKIYV